MYILTIALPLSEPLTSNPDTLHLIGKYFQETGYCSSCSLMCNPARINSNYLSEVKSTEIGYRMCKCTVTLVYLINMIGQYSAALFLKKKEEGC